MSSIRYANQNVTEIDKKDIPTEVPIIPLRNAVVYPSVLLPIFVGRTESVNLVEKYGKPGTLVGLFSQKSPTEEKVKKDSLYHTGTLAEIHRVLPMGEGGYQVFLQGVQKIELVDVKQYDPFLKGRIMPLGELQDFDESKLQAFQSTVLKYVETHPGIPDEVAGFVKRLNNPSALANQVVFFSQREIEEKIDFLKISSINEKINAVEDSLVEETNRLKMENEVRTKVEKDAETMQREFYLRKQMETIRKELGESDDDEVDDLEKQLAEKWLPDYMRKVVNKELKRLRRASEGPQSGGMEAGQLRNWLELVAELPWEDPDPRSINLKDAGRILDEDHEGLEEVKKRIIEFLAVEKQTGGAKAPILCLVGPPGVGKTSLATSIARAMDRPMVRAALGGMRDEAEIRGHRRTYVGALPGKVLTSMKKAETRDPVFLLDEIDKTGASYQGDPAAALLEVLDPEQNHSFEDHYLGQPYDLSRVLFIATANNMDGIPLPLLDRMEVVQLSGYTIAEKKAIAENHLMPKILEQLKLGAKQIELTEEALSKIIKGHTREAGVRSLKRKLESVARKAIRTLLEEHEEKQEKEAANAQGDSAADSAADAKVADASPTEKTEQASQPIVTDGAPAPDGEKFAETAKEAAEKAEYQSPLPELKKIVYDEGDIKDLLGRDRFYQDLKENTGIPGVAIGLAWTPVGGDILYIEATSYKGKGGLQLSGQLGDVMKESAYAALSFIRAHAEELDIDPSAFNRSDIHIHIPSGAIPKDGPSAGVTLLTALTSLFSRRPVIADTAMTGEISLRGKILPVGGIKEKVLAARAAGITTVLLPEKNRPDFEEIPEHVTEGLTAEYYSDMMELVRRTVPRPEGAAASAPTHSTSVSMKASAPTQDASVKESPAAPSNPSRGEREGW